MICDSLVKGLAVDVSQKLSFRREDISDTDLLSLLAGIEYDQLLIFCNNLAFTQGTLNR